MAKGLVGGQRPDHKNSEKNEGWPKARSANGLDQQPCSDTK